MFQPRFDRPACPSRPAPLPTTGPPTKSSTRWAELFSVLSTPIRLKIISALCHGEKNVSQLLEQIDTTQPNMSQHLATLYRAGILGKRRDSTQIYYSLQSERVAALCPRGLHPGRDRTRQRPAGPRQRTPAPGRLRRPLRAASPPRHSAVGDQGP